MNRLYKKPAASAAPSRSASTTSVSSKGSALSLDPKAWTKDDVGAYLDLIELGEYKQIFRDNDIKGADLLELTADDLMHLGVSRIGPRKRIH